MENKVRELKINVHAEPISGLHLSDYNFECLFYVHPNRVVSIPKADMTQVDEDNYTALITTEIGRKLGIGHIKMQMVAYIPDGDFPDELRTEVSEEVCTEAVLIHTPACK